MDRLVPQLPAGSGGSGGGRASSSATTQRHPLSVLLALQLLLSVLGLAGAYTPLSDGSLRSIPAVAPAEFDIHNSGADALLAPLLVTRVPGTPGSEAAQRHLAGFFERRLPGWSVAWHNTTARTPATGAQMVPFRNIIVRRDPPWTTGQGNEHRRGDVGYLTLVAHYDSLYKPDFIGATDSAAPCAMLLHVARSVEEALKRKWEDVVAQGMADFEEPMGVQILLLDGEEAWVSWSAEDSLYGSRALAASWEATPHPALSTYQNPLSAITLFVLLDLLGATEPHIPSYFLPTHWAYQNLATLEKRMRDLGLMESHPRVPFLPESGKKSAMFSKSFVEDDHVPFMARGVNVLHLIPSPFPDVWHKTSDDGEHLDMQITRDWARLMAAFVAEWMDLEGFVPPLAKERKAGRAEHADAEAVAEVAAKKLKARQDQKPQKPKKEPVSSKTEL